MEAGKNNRIIGQLRFSLAAGAKAPAKASLGAAGFDCFAFKREFLASKRGELIPIKPGEARPFDLVRYSTGVSVEIPDYYVGLALARSSVSKMPLIMANTTGVIDSDFRGEVSFTFRILDAADIERAAYQVGDRIGQLVFIKLADFELADVPELSDSARGSGAFGSTGRR